VLYLQVPSNLRRPAISAVSAATSPSHVDGRARGMRALLETVERPRLVFLHLWIGMPEQNSLIIFFHGIGASGAQLMPVATSWRKALPDSRFAAPNAPFTHWRGHQWFRVDGNPLAPENIRSARDGFDQTV
jgi:hypothetical protein